ncbi:MAG: hypothetical protein RMK74_13795 [Myxococcales bacterium]|nr:hypothetical protein [Myxococcales bacterium]
MSATLLLALAPYLALVRAQDARDTWSAGPTRVQVAVDSWGPDCGVRPTSHELPGAGSVQVRQERDTLVVEGRLRRRSDRCWSENPAMRVVSRTRLPDRWIVRCATPPDDPRSERATYTVVADGADRWKLLEEAHYHWRLNDSVCRLTSRSETLVALVQSEPAEPTVPSPSPSVAPSTPTASACAPGPPHRLRVVPSEATIASGESLRVRAVLVDAAGCALPDPALEWSLEGSAADGATFRGGTLVAGPHEGDLRVRVRHGELRAEAVVHVRRDDLSDLLAVPESRGASDERAKAEPATGRAAGVEARAVGGSKPTAGWIVLASSIAAALVGAGVWTALRRARRTSPGEGATSGASRGAPESDRVPSPREAAMAAPVPSVAPTSVQTPRVARVCPLCRREVRDERHAFCPQDGSPLVDRASFVGQPFICPSCRRGYPGELGRCPTDGDELVPYAFFTARARARERGAERTKICPQCGDRFPASTSYCGKDGAELVSVN